MKKNGRSGLLGNALSSIRIGLEDFASAEDGRASSAARNLHAGLLLLYKEKLRQLSPSDSSESLLMERVQPELGADGSVVWKGVGKKTASRLNVEKRLSSLGVSVDWKKFDKVARLRHEVEHHHTEEPPDAIREIVASSFILVRDFLEPQLGLEPADALGEEAWKAMLDTAEVFNKERAECLQRLMKVSWSTKGAAAIVEELRCTECESSLVEPMGGESDDVVCRACGGEATMPEILETALEDIYGYSDYRAAQDG